MSRPRMKSKVQIPPRIKGFLPLGYYGRTSEPVNLLLEEYETLRLLDYENLTQEEAANIMEISRPTLTRIYERARKKTATALTESRQLSIEGGTAVFSNHWYECKDCGSRFNRITSRETEKCLLCNSREIFLIREGAA